MTKHCLSKSKSAVAAAASASKKKKKMNKKKAAAAAVEKKAKMSKTSMALMAAMNPNKSFNGNENKSFINSMFSVKIMTLIQQTPNFNFDDSFIGAFDGMERKTSNTLMSMGFKQSSILLSELNETVTKSHLMAGFAVHQGVDFGHDFYDEMYREECQAWRVYNCLGWYFDTCGEISTQKESVLSTIRKLALVDGAVLAFTFCRSRMSLAQFEDEKRRFLQDLKVLLVGKRMELKVDCHHDYSGSSMFQRSRESHMNSFVCSAFRWKFGHDVDAGADKVAPEIIEILDDDDKVF